MKRSWVIVPLLLFTSGCGGVGDVKGTVRFKGEKLKSGTVTASASNGTFQAAIDPDGQYALRGVGTGTVKFFVYVENPKMVDLVKDLAGKKDAGGKTGGRAALVTADDAKTLAKANLVPSKYSDQTKPLLTFEVVRGANLYDIKLDP
ncbi:MAG: hypothetical protein U0793_10255 [Gemmataceae bacterium]